MSSNFDSMRIPPVEISLTSIRVGFFFVLLKVYNPPLAFLPYWPAVVARCERIPFFFFHHFILFYVGGSGEVNLDYEPSLFTGE